MELSEDILKQLLAMTPEELFELADALEELGRESASFARTLEIKMLEVAEQPQDSKPN